MYSLSIFSDAISILPLAKVCIRSIVWINLYAYSDILKNFQVLSIPNPSDWGLFGVVFTHFLKNIRFKRSPLVIFICTGAPKILIILSINFLATVDAFWLRICTASTHCEMISCKWYVQISLFRLGQWSHNIDCYSL